MSSSIRDIKLLIVGKPGVGKSATANMILGGKHFKSSPSTENESATKDFQSASLCYKGRKITVVDCEGFQVTALDEENDSILTSGTKNQLFTHAEGGLDAFLLVHPFGVRFTMECEQTISRLKQMYGEHFLRFCILVMTHGDSYDATETQIESLHSWMDTQEGNFKKLFKECGKRCVLFENKTTDETKRTSQIDHLLEIIDQRSVLRLKYTEDDLKMAQYLRKKTKVEALRHLIKIEVEEEACLIKQQLDTIKSSEPEQQQELLEGLRRRGKALRRRIKELDNGTGVLKDIIESVDVVRCVECRMKAVIGKARKPVMQVKQRQIMEKQLATELCYLMYFIVIICLSCKENFENKKHAKIFVNRYHSKSHHVNEKYLINLNM